jgi:hypothetical protein
MTSYSEDVANSLCRRMMGVTDLTLEGFKSDCTLRPSSHALGVRHFVYFVSTISIKSSM